MKKNPFPKFGNGKGMKKSILKVRERESEASILGNDREREFPLTPAPLPNFWTSANGISKLLFPQIAKEWLKRSWSVREGSGYHSG